MNKRLTTKRIDNNAWHIIKFLKTNYLPYTSLGGNVDDKGKRRDQQAFKMRQTTCNSNIFRKTLRTTKETPTMSHLFLVFFQ